MTTFNAAAPPAIGVPLVAPVANQGFLITDAWYRYFQNTTSGLTGVLAQAEAYADAGDAATLVAAKAYADSGDATTLVAAKAYADAGDVATLATVASIYAHKGANTDITSLGICATLANTGGNITLNPNSGAGAVLFVDGTFSIVSQSGKGRLNTTGTGNVAIIQNMSGASDYDSALSFNDGQTSLHSGHGVEHGAVGIHVGSGDFPFSNAMYIEASNDPESGVTTNAPWPLRLVNTGQYTAGGGYASRTRLAFNPDGTCVFYDGTSTGVSDGAQVLVIPWQASQGIFIGCSLGIESAGAAAALLDVGNTSTGSNSIMVTNKSTGTAANARLQVWNSSHAVQLYNSSTGLTPSGLLLADQGVLSWDGAGGFLLDGDAGTKLIVGIGGANVAEFDATSITFSVPVTLSGGLTGVINNAVFTGTAPIWKSASSSSGAVNRTFTLLDASQSQINYGGYTGSWRSALQIQNNDNSNFLFFVPGDASGTSNAVIFSSGANLDLQVGTSGDAVVRIYTSSEVQLAGYTQVNVDIFQQSLAISGTIPSFQHLGNNPSSGGYTHLHGTWNGAFAAQTGNHVFYRSRGAVIQSATGGAVTNNDVLGSIQAVGDDGTNGLATIVSSRIQFSADGNFSNASVPGKIQLLTANTSGGTRAVLQANSAGVIQFSTYGAGTLVTDSAGNISATSDPRLKSVVTPYLRGLADILAIANDNRFMAGFTWLPVTGFDQENTYYSFMAYDDFPIVEALGVHQENGYNTFNDRPIVMAMVNALKTIDDRLTALEQKEAA